LFRKVDIEKSELEMYEKNKKSERNYDNKKIIPKNAEETLFDFKYKLGKFFIMITFFSFQNHKKPILLKF
jgi:hypothetical protein